MTMFKDLRLTWTDCDEAEDYVVPNALSPMDLVFRPYIMDKIVKSSSCLMIMYTTFRTMQMMYPTYNWPGKC